MNDPHYPIVYERRKLGFSEAVLAQDGTADAEELALDDAVRDLMVEAWVQGAGWAGGADDEDVGRAMHAARHDVECLLPKPKAAP
jgi:hypothetical protein